MLTIIRNNRHFLSNQKSTIVCENSTVFTFNCSIEPLYVEECFTLPSSPSSLISTLLSVLLPQKGTSLRVSRVAPHSARGLFIRKTPSWCIPAVVLKNLLGNWFDGNYITVQLATMNESTKADVDRAAQLTPSTFWYQITIHNSKRGKVQC